MILLANKSFFGQIILIILNRKDRLLLPFFSFLMFFFGIAFQPLLESKGFGHLLFCLPFLPFKIGKHLLQHFFWVFGLVQETIRISPDNVDESGDDAHRCTRLVF